MKYNYCRGLLIYCYLYVTLDIYSKIWLRNFNSCFTDKHKKRQQHTDQQRLLKLLHTHGCILHIRSQRSNSEIPLLLAVLLLSYGCGQGMHSLIVCLEMSNFITLLFFGLDKINIFLLSQYCMYRCCTQSIIYPN